MKISVVFEFNSINSSSADTNLDTLAFIKNFRQLATWQFKESLKETEKENIWMAVEKMRKGEKKFERKRKRYKLRREEIDVTEELQLVRLLL